MTHLYTGTHTVQGACPTCGKRIAVQVAITPRLTVTTEKSPLPGMTEPTEERA